MREACGALRVGPPRAGHGPSGRFRRAPGLARCRQVAGRGRVWSDLAGRWTDRSACRRTRLSRPPYVSTTAYAGEHGLSQDPCRTWAPRRNDGATRRRAPTGAPPARPAPYGAPRALPHHPARRLAALLRGTSHHPSASPRTTPTERSAPARNRGPAHRRPQRHRHSGDLRPAFRCMTKQQMRARPGQDRHDHPRRGTAARAGRTPAASLNRPGGVHPCDPYVGRSWPRPPSPPWWR